MEFCASALIMSAGLILCVISDRVIQGSSAAGGILTDRLSRDDQRTWNSIRKIALAQDRKGQPKHPRLFDLWCRVEPSGHEVHIELIEQGPFYSSQAGKFTIEVLDPNGRRHICAIRLNLSAIRQAYTRTSAIHTDGFVPMLGLGEKERYAEVLGHEMAHAVAILLDRTYLQLYRDLDKEVVEYEHHLESLDGGPEHLEEHLNRIKFIQGAIEKPAQAAEAEIWRELRGGR